MVKKAMQARHGRNSRISRATWRAWETKERPLNLDQLQAIRDAFQLSKVACRAIIDWWWKDDPAEGDQPNPAQNDGVRKTSPAAPT